MNFEDADLDKVKTGMIVAFESDGGFVNRRIEAYQRAVGFSARASKITHVAVSMGGQYIIEATFPKSRTANLFVDHQGRNIHFLYYDDEQFRLEHRKNMTIWAATRCNLDYGWPALFGFYLHSLVPLWSKNPLSSSRAPFCSYLVAWALRRMGYDPWQGVASNLITPAHIFESEFFEKVDVSRSPRGGLSSRNGKC